MTLSKRARAAQHPAAGVERGPRPAAAMGPAMVAADATGARVRERPARVRRPLRRLDRGRGEDGRARRGRLGRARRHPRRRWRVRPGRGVEGSAGVVDGRAHPPHRERRAGGRRRQPLHRDRVLAARWRRRDPACRPERRGRDDRGRRGVAGCPRRNRRGGRARPRCGAAANRARQRDAGRRSRWPGPAARPASGGP